MAHKTTGFNRSPILAYDDLTDAQKQDLTFADENTQYVIFKYKDGEQLLALSEFVRFGSLWMPEKNPIWSGMYVTSFSDAFFIRLNQSNDEALICRRYFI